VKPKAVSQATRRVQRRYDCLARALGRSAALAAEGRASPWRRRLWESLPSGLVLEVGVGAGVNLSHYPREANVVALDLSAAMLAEASERGTPAALLQADAQHLPFRDGSFDGVVGSLVLCSVPSPLLALSEVRRVCKPGARLVFLEHGRGGGLLGPLMDLLDPLVERLAGGEHINRRQQALLREAGCTVERVDSFIWGIVQLIRART